MSGAKIATRISRITTTPPASATLSRLSRDQAICHSERPRIGWPPTVVGGTDDGDVPGVSTSPSPVKAVADVAESGPNTICALPLSDRQGTALQQGRRRG